MQCSMRRLVVRRSELEATRALAKQGGSDKGGDVTGMQRFYRQTASNSSSSAVRPERMHTTHGQEDSSGIYSVMGVQVDICAAIVPENRAHSRDNAVRDVF